MCPAAPDSAIALSSHPPVTMRNIPLILAGSIAALFSGHAFAGDTTWTGGGASNVCCFLEKNSYVFKICMENVFMLLSDVQKELQN